MVEDLQRFMAIFAVTYFGIGIALVKEKWHLTIPFIDLVNINVYTNFYQNIPHG